MFSASITKRPDRRPSAGVGTSSMRSDTKLKGSGAVGTLPADAAGSADWSLDPARAPDRVAWGVAGTSAKTRETSTGVTVIHQRVRQ